MLKFKIIPSIDQSPKLIAFAQTKRGKLTLVASFSTLFCILLPLNNKYINFSQGFLWDKFLILSLFIFFPNYKKLLLLLATIYWLIVHNFPHWPKPVLKLLSLSSANQDLILISAVLCILLIVLLNYFLRKIWWNVFVFLSLINLGLYFLGPQFQSNYWAAISTSVSIILANYAWYLIFILKDKHYRYWHLLTMIPFWSWSNIPFPKAWKYLNETEVIDKIDLARTQLNAIKLLVYCVLLSIPMHLLDTYLYAYPTILKNYFHLETLPLVNNLNTAITQYGTSQGLSFIANWSATFCSFIHTALYLTIGTNAIIATIRLCGWRVRRNVYRCFEATSISDFFNRYYYYFKEFLVDIFFFPTYFSFFKKYPSLRLFFATLMAAGVGNFIFHFNSDIARIYDLGYWKALVSYQVYALYCLVLSLAIFISQWSRINRKFQHPIILVRLRIILFFMLLHTLLETQGTTTIKQHLDFIAGLLGF